MFFDSVRLESVKQFFIFLCFEKRVSYFFKLFFFKRIFFSFFFFYEGG